MVLNSFRNVASCSASVGCSSTEVWLFYVMCAYVCWPCWTGMFVLKELGWSGCLLLVVGMVIGRCWLR